MRASLLLPYAAVLLVHASPASAQATDPTDSILREKVEFKLGVALDIGDYYTAPDGSQQCGGGHGKSQRLPFSLDILRSAPGDTWFTGESHVLTSFPFENLTFKYQVSVMHDVPAKDLYIAFRIFDAKQVLLTTTLFVLDQEVAETISVDFSKVPYFHAAAAFPYGPDQRCWGSYTLFVTNWYPKTADGGATARSGAPVPFRYTLGQSALGIAGILRQLRL